MEVAKELKTKIYPNPVQGSEHLSIEINLEIEAIHIIDQNGKDITGELEIAPLNGIYNIDVNTLKSGIYFIEVVSSKQKASYKFLKL